MVKFVYTIALSQAQAVSCHFLAELISQSENPEALTFLPNKEDLYLNSPIAGAKETGLNLEDSVNKQTASLLVFGEGLNIEKLNALQEGLGSSLEIKAYKLLPPKKGAQGFALEAKVQVVEVQAINKVLENLATSLQLELVYLTSRPTLSKPGLLLMDMDSTVIDVECIDEIAKLAGVGQQVSEVTELAMQGKLDFAESLNSRVACLKDADESILKQVRDALPLMPGLTRLINVLKEHNWKVAIASGGFTYFADYLMARLELDGAKANTLEIIEGKLTGKVLGGIVDANVKAQTLESMAQEWGISPSQTVAMGDGANDLVMMKSAGLGVAFHAKPIVREQAQASIRFAGLDALLWMLET